MGKEKAELLTFGTYSVEVEATHQSQSIVPTGKNTYAPRGGR
jgi:hypothetical protein